jgi:Oxidoreductase molybdopterin binding domain
LSTKTNVNSQAAARSRRAFLTLGLGAAAGYGGWEWLRSRPKVDGVEWPVRGVLRRNENVAEAYFSDSHLAPAFDASKADPETRVNGDIGLGDGFNPGQWSLRLQDADGGARQITMSQIRELPRVEQTTQLNCIEGWTQIVRWAGARFADFTAKFAPNSRDAAYVRLQTPDQAYFVGLDRASALHPQTLLCYEMNGADLTMGHGAPLRLVIPVKYGVKNIKRIGTIAYTNKRPQDYWANEGYDWYAGL